jgi:imidazolonepropionase
MPTKVINAGLPLALAKDYNPGSATSGNINLVVSLICITLKIGPKEAVNVPKLIVLMPWI